MVQEDIDNEIRELARNYMSDSKLYQLPDHVKEDTDISLWKTTCELRKDNGSTLVRLFMCPMRYQCG